MTDEEKAEEYVDKLLCDEKCSSLIGKEKIKKYILKVYLDSLECCKKSYEKGLAEGRAEKQFIIDTQTVEIESREVYLAEKESIIIRQQNEIQELKMKLLTLENKEQVITTTVSNWEVAE